MLILFFVYAVLGKLLIYLFQSSPFSDYLSFNREFLKELFDCDLCLGVWVYFILAIIFGDWVNLFPFILDYYDIDYIRIFIAFVITSFMTGAFTSFVVHIFSIGWDAKFRIMEIK